MCEVEFPRCFLPSTLSREIQGFDNMISNVWVSGCFVLFKKCRALFIQKLCLDWPTATWDRCTCCTEDCSLKAMLCFFNWDTARGNCNYALFQSAAVRFLIGLAEVPSLLGWAMYDGQLKVEAQCGWVVVYFDCGEVVKYCLACWQWVIPSGGDPAEVSWVVLLPPCWVERPSLFGIVGQRKIVVGCPLH